MKKFRHIILALTALILASCAVDEFWEGMDHTEGEEVVMTFKPRFEDFESVTKTIGDGSQVNQLLVHVYEEGTSSLDTTYTFEIKNCSIKDQDQVQIPFYYGKKYEVYFWAYKSGENSPYTISETGLKGGVSVNYPTDSLGFNALESLDAFYAVSEDVDLSNGRTIDVNLTRPFAQVNLVANMADLATAQATMVEFKINVATSFVPGATPATTAKKTFTFYSDNHFQDNDPIEPGKVYLGTTYLFVPESRTLMGELNIYSGKKVLKSASNVEIPLASNKRTNLVFSGIVPSVPDWDDTKDDTPPTPGSDGWIHISTPEQLAALLRTGVTSETKVHICKDLDMTNMPDEVKAEISGKSFKNLILDGAHYSGTLENHTVPETSVDGGAYKIKNFEGPAFLANATNLKVRNLGLEKVHITHKDKDKTRHVGTLVNTLKGTSAFTNVQVKESYASTLNGAAGGVVGYIVRTSETDRAESMDVKFDNCSIEGSKIMPTAAGTEAEGKFVGLFSGYDNGEKLVFTNCSADENTTVADYLSRYVEGNEGEWLESNNYELYDGFLGEETYNRGTIILGENQFIPMWDGIKTVKPIYEDSAEKIAQIWSAFDLAYLQGKSLTTLRFKSDVDMCGVCDNCKNGNGNSTIANDDLSTCEHCKPFDAILSLNNLYGEYHTLYNLFVQGVHEANSNNNQGRAFIRKTNAGTFENFTFEGAVIKCIDDIEYRDDDQIGGNGYAGTLTSKVEGKMILNNVHANKGHIIGISKFGGMIGSVGANLTAEGCTVNNYIVENHKINVINRYEENVEKTFGSGFFKITVYASCEEEFYTEGECGGFIGFIIDSATITDCHVYNTMMKCYGQDNKTTWVKGGLSKSMMINVMQFEIAGRHCNTFIGDIRTTKTSTSIVINNCTADDTNTYVDGYDKDITKEGDGELVGCCYFVGKTVSISNREIHVGDYQGRVTINGKSMPFIGG